MTDLAGAVQRALFVALSGVAGMPPVVSEAPISVSGDQEIVVYPFVLLGDDEVTDIGSKDARLERHEVAVHVCMQSATKLSVRGVQELVRATLVDGAPLAAPGAILSRPAVMSQNTPLLEDGATYVGGQVFLILAQDAA